MNEVWVRGGGHGTMPGTAQIAHKHSICLHILFKLTFTSSWIIYSTQLEWADDPPLLQLNTHSPFLGYLVRSPQPT